jgi:diaminopimelate epimerase
MRFVKMHGAGNDFVLPLIPESDLPLPPPELARALCRRHLGIGADGMLLAGVPTRRGAELRMRMFNPDGTEDECGNGLRCFALHAVEHGLVATRSFAVETLKGIRRCKVHSGPQGAADVSVELGVASTRPEDVPTLLSWEPAPGSPGALVSVEGEHVAAYPISTGTAHLVIFDTPNEQRFQRLSPLLEHHPAFPERTSVLWVEMLSPAAARVRIWERGVGETLACGTGACAVAAVARLTGRSGTEVAVTSPGGTLLVQTGPDLRLTLTGPARTVFHGVWRGACR